MMNVKALLIAIGIQLGFGFIAGLIVGYTFKKVTKIVAIILGLFFVGVQLLAYYKLITVNWLQIAKVTEGAIAKTTATNPMWWTVLIYNFPYIATFTTGFVLGFKKG